ncbi:MAG: hypothetical protein K8U03_00315 [Planctomycetia bacterium]|nr:hypothetical protein [Planctomycetia bacterium]
MKPYWHALGILLAIGCRLAPAAELPADFARTYEVQTQARSPYDMGAVSHPHTKAGSEHVRDNGFLIEEAFNQEANEIQHIANWVYQWDRYAGVSSREWIYAYTMDVPLGSQDHEFSITVPLVGGREKVPGAADLREAGVADTLLSYRYQLLSSDDFLWCAPRASLIVPTGDSDYRLGVGEVGYEFFLPVSRYGKNFDFHFNLGYTYFPQMPNVVLPGLIDLESYLDGWTIGGTVLWKPRYDLHYFVEAVLNRNTGYNDFGRQFDLHQALINPGVRYAPFRSESFEWVVGVSVPIGLTAITPDVGAFVYMSLEHVFRDAE